eukprot:289147_1
MACLSRITLPLYLALIDAIGNARVFSVFQKYSDGSVSSHRKVLASYTWQVFSCSFPFITQTVNPIEILGNLTVLCFTDKPGILSESRRSVEHVLLWEKNPVVLDIIQDVTSSNGIAFEGEWTDHLSTLKPLGLACILNSQCSWSFGALSARMCGSSNSHSIRNTVASPEHALYTHSADRILVDRYPSYCLCSLGKEIGFLQDQCDDKFERGKELRSVEYQPNRQMHSMYSVAVRTSEPSDQNCSHLFTRGSTEMVKDHCRYLWRGNRISPLSHSHAVQIMEIFRHWEHEDLHCVALAYTPIPKGSESILFGGSSDDEQDLSILESPIRARSVCEKTKFNVKQRAMSTVMYLKIRDAFRKTRKN